MLAPHLPGLALHFTGLAPHLPQLAQLVFKALVLPSLVCKALVFQVLVAHFGAGFKALGGSFWRLYFGGLVPDFAGFILQVAEAWESRLYRAGFIVLGLIEQALFCRL